MAPLERGLTWAGEHTTQQTDDVAYNCAPETYAILLTTVTPRNSIKRGKNIVPYASHCQDAGISSTRPRKSRLPSLSFKRSVSSRQGSPSVSKWSLAQCSLQGPRAKLSITPASPQCIGINVFLPLRRPLPGNASRPNCVFNGQK